MPLISSAIPNLINGVSQQPDALRQPSQAQLQENCYSSVVEGLKRRAPAELIAKLMSGTLASAHVHNINRDATERYVAFIPSGDLIVHGIDGSKKYVGFPNGKVYLTSLDAKEGFRTITIADYTFVVNTSVSTSMDAATSPAAIKQAIVAIKQAAFDSTYEIEINGTVQATYATGSTGVISTVAIADDLKTDLTTNLGGAYTIAREGSTIHIKKNDNTDFTIKVHDTKGSTLIKVAKDKVQKFTDLPVVAPRDFVVEILGDNSSQFDNYYVKFSPNNASASFDEGVWVETLAPGIPFKPLAATMPHVLVRDPKTVTQTSAITIGSTAVTLAASHTDIYVGMKVTGAGILSGTTVTAASGTNVTLSNAATATNAAASLTFACDFVFKEAEWGEREAGDEDSAQDPSFIGNTMNDVFLFKNRLCFLSQENAICSRAGKFFEFWPSTVTTLLDDGPIDVAASNITVSILKHAAAFDEKVLMFSDQAQFVFQGGDLLTPKTASTDLVTQYETSNTVHPVALGNTVYFGVPKGFEYSGVREYYVDQTTGVKDASDVTSHVPKYIPNGLFKLAACSSESLLCAVATGDPTAIFPYKFFWSGNDKLQASWSKWTFNGATVLNCDFINTQLYVVFQRSDGVYLCRIDVAPGRIDADQNFTTHLDFRVDETMCTSSYDAATNRTTWTLPYAVNPDADYAVVTRGSGIPGTTLQGLQTSGSTVSVRGDHTATQVYIGERYRSRYVLSKFVVRKQAANGSSVAVSTGRIQLRTITAVYDSTGYFEVQVTHAHRETPSTYKFTGRTLGALTNVIGKVALAAGKFIAPVLGQNEEVSVEFTSDSFLPFNILSATWEAFYTTRSQVI